MPAKDGTIHFKIDTGADVTVISEEDLPKLNLNRQDVKPTRKKLTGPENHQLKCIGYIITTITWGNKSTKEICYVCKDLKKALLGKTAINRLQIIKLEIPSSYRCSPITETKPDENENKFIQEFPEVFQGLGCIKGKPIQVKLKDNLTPYQITAPRHSSIPLLERVSEELKRMEELGVIRKVDEPTEWCHPIVVVMKPNGNIRLCLDLTKLNEGIEREFYQLEGIDETIVKLGEECVIMSKLDANSGYWQIPLEEKSQLLATFITPIGRFCPTRGPFGMSSMQEIFNKRMDTIVEGLPGVAKSTDDFLVYGRNELEHDKRLRQLLSRFKENNVTLNKEKCKFQQTETEFLGYKLSKDGIRPIATKTDAILKFKRPDNITKLRRFLGMAQQMSEFSKNLVESAAPLRDLLSNKNYWTWSEIHESSFNNIKHQLSTPPILDLFFINDNLYDVHLYGYTIEWFDSNYMKTKIRVDGSKLNGISVILYQKQSDGEWTPVTCASRFLSKAERNYHNIEIEMLAIAWGCKKMHMYLHGLPHFTVQTDHKPLIPIINKKPLAEMSPRIQRMRMSILQYSFTAEHIKGEELVDADALSRSPVDQPLPADALAEQDILIHINTIITQMPASDERIQQIKIETAKDKQLQLLIDTIHKGWPNSKHRCHDTTKPFWDSRLELTEIDGVILKGTRLVIPEVMKKEMLDRLHEGHQGMEKCKRRARQSCYWPSMNNQLEQIIRRCDLCLNHLPSKSSEPLQPPPLPTKPWQKIGTDLFSCDTKDYLLITDYYSLWPEVYELGKTESENVIEATKQAFSHHGIPQEVVSDNGPQFISQKYNIFQREWEFKRVPSSPRYPQANGLIESSVKTIKTMIKKCDGSRDAIFKGLLAIRNTPLQCGYSPAQLMMGRRLRDNVPNIEDAESQRKTKETFRNLVEERTTQKLLFDRKKASCKTSEPFRVGQKVAVQDHTSGNWTKRGIIEKEVAPRSFQIKLNTGITIKRNTKHIRQLYSLSSSNHDEPTPDFIVNRTETKSAVLVDPDKITQRRESTAAFSTAAVIADEDYFLDGKITAIVYICVV